MGHGRQHRIIPQDEPQPTHPSLDRGHLRRDGGLRRALRECRYRRTAIRLLRSEPVQVSGLRPEHPYLSCLLIRNDIPYRWRGRYNEDTDLCLRVLKDGWVTVQFNAFVQEKARTGVVPGGNTDEFYTAEGTLPKSRLLEEMHPDVAKVIWKYGRWHHHVNYRPFRANRLVRRPGLEMPIGINDYGMSVVKLERPK